MSVQGAASRAPAGRAHVGEARLPPARDHPCRLVDRHQSDRGPGTQFTSWAFTTRAKLGCAAPFGELKASGQGSAGGPEGIDEYLVTSSGRGRARLMSDADDLPGLEDVRPGNTHADFRAALDRAAGEPRETWQGR